jgi:methylmalonyl-CoA mutase
MEVCAKAIREDLERGVDALWLRCGSQHGVRILTAGDLALVLEGVDLSRVSVCLEPEADALPMGAALVAVARHRGVPLQALSGGFGADPLGTLARVGTLPAGLAATMRAAVDLALWSAEHTPGMRTMLASSRPYADAGATTVDELVWTVATATAYLKALCAAGLSVDAAAGQIRFAFSVSGHFFAQIAKLRAARLVWSKVVAAAGGGAEAQAMALHARTAHSTKAARDPWVNMLRGTAESFAAAVGGAESVATAPFDECVGASDSFARRAARNTQLVLREESHLHEVLDPAGGSWFIEQLTDQIARAAWEGFRDVERLGGMERALTLGQVRTKLETTRAARLERVRSRKDAVVGVSEVPNLAEEPVTRAPVDMQEVEVELGLPLGPAGQDARIAKLHELARVAMSTEEATGTLTALAVEAAELGVDLDTMGVVLAEGQPSVHVVPLEPFRVAAPWEALRDASDDFLTRTGARPKACIVALGTVAQHTARATWVANALAAGGIESSIVHELESAEDAASRFAESRAALAILCGPDALYAELGAATVKALVGAGAKHVVVAGKPGELKQALEDAGAGSFLYAGQDLLAALELLHRQLGVSAS